MTTYIFFLKKRFPLIFYFGFCLICVNVFADKNNVLDKYSLNDPMFSNQAFAFVIRNAILSDDVSSINRILLELRDFSDQIYIEAWLQNEVFKLKSEIPSRSLKHIPEFKHFLINYWQTNFDKTGSVPTDVSSKLLDEISGLEDLLVFFDSYPWTYVPEILSTFYPGDSDVHDFIWHIHSRSNPTKTMTLLNKGQFRTEEATNLRIKILREGVAQKSPYREVRDIAVHHAQALNDAELATQALGRFRTPDGLQTLADHIHRTELYPTIITAIVAYGKEAEPYLETLKSLKEHDLAKRHAGPYKGVIQTVEFLEYLIDHSQCCKDQQQIPLYIFEQFSKSEIFDRQFPNKTVHPLVKNALSDPRPQVLDYVLRGIGNLSVKLELGYRGDDKPIPPIRRLSDIPGFKELLIEHWMDRINDNDRNTNNVRIDSYESTKRPGWHLIPEILSIHFPRDVEVQNFLWDAVKPIEMNRLLRVLNNSQDASDKATRLRITQLQSKDLEVVKEAALGLGWVPSDMGLEALAKELGRRDDALPVIIKSLVAYGQDAEPYLHRLEQISSDRAFTSMSVQSRENSLSSLATLDYIFNNPWKFILQY